MRTKLRCNLDVGWESEAQAPQIGGFRQLIAPREDTEEDGVVGWRGAEKIAHEGGLYTKLFIKYIICIYNF